MTPAPGYNALFERPVFAWTTVAGATGYQVDITDQASGATVSTETTPDTTLVPSAFHMGSTYVVQVTALPDGPTASRTYVVRGLRSTPDVTSAQTLCNGAEGTGSMTAYSVAYLNGRVYSTFNADGAGICAYDAQTLAYLQTHPGVGGHFRSFGLCADAANRRLYVTYFPMVGDCADTMNRLARLDFTNGTPTTRYFNAKVESAQSVACANNRVYMTGLREQSCYNQNMFCLEAGEACSQGWSSVLAWDTVNQRDLWHAATPFSTPGMAADDVHVYRPSYLSSLLVHDAATGALVADVPTGTQFRGLIRMDAEGRHFLLASGWDQTLRIYVLNNLPLQSVTDVVEVNRVSMAERYWQGSFDGVRAFFFPGQDTRKIYRHDLAP